MSTTYPNVKDIKQDWILIDAKDQVLGRMASKIATRLRGKHKPEYTPFFDTGDFVVVINAERVRVTGKKTEQKEYQRYSGYPGGQKVENFETVMEKDPERIIRQAVKGMLPHGPLGRAMLKKLKVYAGTEHPHAGQNPQPVALS